MRAKMVLTVALLVLAGCSGDQAAAPPDQPQGSASAPIVSSPLVELIGFSSDNEINRQQFVAIQRESDALVAACMSSQGFTWAPSVPPPGSALAAGNRASIAWARAHGLGVTDQIAGLAQTASADPNEPYLETLSDPDRERWQVALRGDTSTLVSDSDEPVLYAPAGCLGDAFAATRPRAAIYQQFEADLRTLAERVQADPRVVAHGGLWADCMAQSGYPYPTMQAMNDDLVNRLVELPGVAQLMTTMGPAADIAPNELGPVVSSSEFQALVELERAVAVADVECASRFMDQAKEVRDSYESRFIIDNQARLDEAVAANLS